MLHHVSLGVHDVERAAKFYDPVLKTLGYRRVMEFLPHAIGYGESRERPEFWIQLPHNQQPASNGNGVHVAFLAKTRQVVSKFHDAALKQGGSNGGEPGPRPDYGPSYYGAFIYDLDGNKVEAMLTITVKAAAKQATAKSKVSKRKAAPAKNAKKAKKKSRR
ncbi:MAG TPA: VOC family protein [Rhizomicrobium sp.]|jgi:catechol 2,3-dioxygenase-like lactoylglutathione lyase family enzyme|nr:VOC family protein [Rhizomicrobium sp.]